MKRGGSSAQPIGGNTQKLLPPAKNGAPKELVQSVVEEVMNPKGKKNDSSKGSNPADESTWIKAPPRRKLNALASGSHIHRRPLSARQSSISNVTIPSGPSFSSTSFTIPAYTRVSRDNNRHGYSSPTAEGHRGDAMRALRFERRADPSPAPSRPPRANPRKNIGGASISHEGQLIHHPSQSGGVAPVGLQSTSSKDATGKQSWQNGPSSELSMSMDRRRNKERSSSGAAMRMRRLPAPSLKPKEPTDRREMEDRLQQYIATSESSGEPVNEEWVNAVQQYLALDSGYHSSAEEPESHVINSTRSREGSLHSFADLALPPSNAISEGELQSPPPAQTSTTPTDYGPVGKVFKPSDLKSRGSITYGYNLSAGLPSSTSEKMTPGAVKGNRRGQGSISSASSGSGTSGGAGSLAASGAKGPGENGDLTSWAVAEAVLEKMTAFCRQKGSAIRFKRDVILQKRQDVAAAVQAFKETYNELMMTHASSPSMKQKNQGKEGVKVKVSKGRHLSPTGKELPPTLGDIQKLEKLKEDAEKLTGGLRGVQLAVVQLLLRLQDYAKEVRKPLGAAGTGGTQEIRGEAFRSPSTISYSNASFPFSNFGALTSGSTTLSGSHSSSEQDCGSHSFSEFVTLQEREIAQQLRNVQNTIETMLAKNSLISIEDISILQTPLFCGYPSAPLSPRQTNASTTGTKAGVLHESPFQPSRPVMSKASDGVLWNGTSATSPMRGKSAGGQTLEKSQNSLSVGLLEQDSNNLLRNGQMSCPLFTVSTSTSEVKTKKTAGSEELQASGSGNLSKERVMLVLSSAAPSSSTSRKMSTPLSFQDILSPSAATMASSSIGKALSMTKPRRTNSSKHQRRSQSVSYQGVGAGDENINERSLSTSHRVATSPGGTFSLLSKTQLEQARQVWTVVSSQLPSEVSDSSKDEKGEDEAEKRDAGKKSVAVVSLTEQVLTSGKEFPKQSAEGVSSSSEKPKVTGREKEQDRSIEPLERKSTGTPSLFAVIAEEGKTIGSGEVDPTSPEKNSKKQKSKKGAIPSQEEKKEESANRTLPPTSSPQEEERSSSEAQPSRNSKGQTLTTSSRPVLRTEANVSPAREARKKSIISDVPPVVSPTRARQKVIVKGSRPIPVQKTSASRSTGASPVSGSFTSPRNEVVSRTVSSRDEKRQTAEQDPLKVSKVEDVPEKGKQNAVVRIAAWWRGCKARLDASERKTCMKNEMLSKQEKQRRLVAGRCILHFWSQCRCRKHLKELIDSNSASSLFLDEGKSLPTSSNSKEKDEFLPLSNSRDRFLRAKEQRRALNAKHQETPIANSAASGGQELRNRLMSPEKRLGRKASRQHGVSISVADNPAVSPVTLLPLVEMGISTTQIAQYNNDSENFDLQVLHRLMRAPSTVVYLLCVLTLKNVHYPPMGYAPLRDKNTPSFESLLYKVRSEKDAHLLPDRPLTTTIGAAIPKGIHRIDNSFLIPYPQLKKLHSPFSVCAEDAGGSSSRESGDLHHTSAKTVVSMPWSPRYESYVKANELRSSHPVVKDFTRPFERWGTSNAFVRRLFTAAAIYSWKLIFSHTPHDDFKQRQLQSQEQRTARLERVDQRNRMILACYFVHSEREWLREASKDISFVGQIWNPKRSLDQNDPDLQQHAREAYEFVEDFLYQCFPSVSGLDEVPSFLLGAGIFFLVRESLNYNKTIRASHIPPWGQKFITKPFDVGFPDSQTEKPLSGYAQAIQQRFELCSLFDRVVQQEARRYQGKPGKTLSSSTLPPLREGGDHATKSSPHPEIEGRARQAISLEVPVDKIVATQATPTCIFGPFSCVRQHMEKDRSADMNNSDPSEDEKEANSSNGLLLLRVPVGPTSEKVFIRDFEDSLLGHVTHWLRQSKDGSQQSAESENECRNFMILYPRNYLVTLSQTLAKLLFGLQLELDVCEEMDCLD